MPVTIHGFQKPFTLTADSTNHGVAVPTVQNINNDTQHVILATSWALQNLPISFNVTLHVVDGFNKFFDTWFTVTVNGALLALLARLSCC